MPKPTEQPRPWYTIGPTHHACPISEIRQAAKFHTAIIHLQSRYFSYVKGFNVTAMTYNGNALTIASPLTANKSIP
jgi:hypothetical protein